MDLRWYFHRLRAMRPSEIAGRVRDQLNVTHWRRRYHARGAAPAARLSGSRTFVGLLPHLDNPPEAARLALLAAADRLLDGHWPTFAVGRTDVTPLVDWHRDPRNDLSLPRDAYTFGLRIHGEALGFDTKYVWELSRHAHTSVLATAYRLTGEIRYARAAADHVQSWIAANPFLHGVHWGSGVELGMRLIAFAWIRRLLQDWPDAPKYFEANTAFVDTVYRHQWLLSRRMSAASSANNHRIYENAGLYVGACAFPWFKVSTRWRDGAREVLEKEFALQTFSSGYSREMASGYNGFVLEALLACLTEGALSGHNMGAGAWDIAARALDTLADLADCQGHPPSQGDSDDAHGLLLDAPDYDRWHDLLDLGSAVFATRRQGESDFRSLRAWLLASILSGRAASHKVLPHPRTTVLPDAGLAVLRAHSGTPREIYCAFDAGPLGYLGIAAHAHADALAVELRLGGQPVLVDPGTFNFVWRREWRDYFRSTAGHNTLELGATDQSTMGGPFLWMRHAQAVLTRWEGLAEGVARACVSGRHNGYESAQFRGEHNRTVTLDRTSGEIRITDSAKVATPTAVRLLFHLHPDVQCRLEGSHALLQWDGGSANMELPQQLDWRMARGEEAPILGWYSPAYDRKQPAVTLVGNGKLAGSVTLTTMIRTC